MDFMNRGQQSNGRPSTVFSAGASDQQPTEHKDKPGPRGHQDNTNKWFRWSAGIVVILVAVLAAAVLGLLLLVKPANEGDLVDTEKLQAVFLTNDQVYFGRVASVNSKYLVLDNIYYLQTSTTNSTNKTQSSGSNVSLVKLGCELHKPQDRMVISQDQITFWENLNADGQVAKAVKSYEDAHPNGQTCDSTTTNTNPVQGSTNTDTNNTNTNQ